MKQISPYRSHESVWDFMSEVERAFDDLWQTSAARTPRAAALETFTPAVDLHENKDFYLVSMDLPGVPEKNIKIDAQQGRLTVSGERSREDKSENGLFRRFERVHGRFERSFALPQNVDQERIQARYENGVLEIVIPKAEVAKSRTIQINKDKGGLFSRLVGSKESEATAAITTEGPSTEKH